MQDINCNVIVMVLSAAKIFWLINLLGIISRKSEKWRSRGLWYTTVSDGIPRYFQTQEEVNRFWEDESLKVR